jgi:hypothetical protein
MFGESCGAETKDTEVRAMARVFSEWIWVGPSFVLCLLGLLVETEAPVAREKSSFPAEGEGTVALARKESEVNLFNSGSLGPALIKGFTKVYPQIKVVNAIGRGGEVEQRILSEQRAGKEVTR